MQEARDQIGVAESHYHYEANAQPWKLLHHRRRRSKTMDHSKWNQSATGCRRDSWRYAIADAEAY